MKGIQIDGVSDKNINVIIYSINSMFNDFIIGSFQWTRRINVIEDIAKRNELVCNVQQFLLEIVKAISSVLHRIIIRIMESMETRHQPSKEKLSETRFFDSKTVKSCVLDIIIYQLPEYYRQAVIYTDDNLDVIIKELYVQPSFIYYRRMIGAIVK